MREGQPGLLAGLRLRQRDELGCERGDAGRESVVGRGKARDGRIESLLVGEELGEQREIFARGDHVSKRRARSASWP